MPAFTTNVEFGMWARSGKAVCGSPPDAPKNQYLAATAARHGIAWHNTLEATIAEAVRVAAAGAAERHVAERYVPASVWGTESFQGWLADLYASGNTLDGIRITHQHPAAAGRGPFLWVAHPRIGIGDEARAKGNEIVVGRPDVSAVVAHGPLASDVADTELVVVSEFRSASRQPGGLVVELPAGSSPNGADPHRTALDELREEAGIDVAPERLVAVGVRQLTSTLCTHRCWLYRVELTEAELDAARSHRGPRGALVDDGEVTYVNVTTPAALETSGTADYSTLGMIGTALAHARKGVHQ